MRKHQEPKYEIAENINGELRIRNRASKEFIPDDEPIFILRGRDKHALDCLRHYSRQVKDDFHECAVVDRIFSFEAFRENNPELMKEPDTEEMKDAPFDGTYAWKGIESAPKDGRSILLYIQERDCCPLGYWSSKLFWCHSGSDQPIGGNPTLWCETPEKPKITTRKVYRGEQFVSESPTELAPSEIVDKDTLEAIQNLASKDLMTQAVLFNLVENAVISATRPKKKLEGPKKRVRRVTNAHRAAKLFIRRLLSKEG